MFSILLPGGMVFLFRKRLSLPLRIISALVIFTMLMEILGFSLYKAKMNNMVFFRAYTYVEATFLFFYYRSIITTPRLKAFHLFIFIAFLLFSFANLFPWDWENFAHHNSIQRGAECIWAIVLLITFYINIFNTSTDIDLLRYPHFWMTSGFLLYFAGTMFQSILMDTYQTTELIQFDISDIHSYLNIFLNIIYTIALWMGSRALTSVR